MNQSVTVYVAHDNRYQIKPNWLLQVEDTEKDLTTTDTNFSIFQQVFPAGTVVLGGNIDPTEVKNAGDIRHYNYFHKTPESLLPESPLNERFGWSQDPNQK